MSPLALQVYACVQTPPWQFVEQHSDPAAQALPSVVQLAIAVDTVAQVELVHVPEQQSVPAEHCAPVLLQALAAHFPDTHEKEQHSLDEVQVPPPLAQKVAEEHFPDEQTVEQHCDPAVQVDPPFRHAAVEEAVHFWVAVSHCPEQHWVPLVQLALSARHEEQ